MTKTFEHILVPHNGTTGSDKAFRKAISLASVINAKITILTCLEERSAFGFFKTKTSKQEFDKEYRIIEKQHHNLEQIAKDHDISCMSKIVKNGIASVKILEFAAKHDVDLIILSKTKLASNYEKYHHHSTIENIFSNTTCPILIL